MAELVTSRNDAKNSPREHVSASLGEDLLPETDSVIVSGPGPKPRLGFVGLGWIGRNRMEAIAHSGLAQIAAISDPSAEACDKAAELALGAIRCADFADLLAQEIDGVVIATPSALHAEQSIAALQAGKAVFCQKPLARNGFETTQVVAAAKAADRLLGIDLSYRHTRALTEVRRLVQAGDLGKIYSVEAVFHNAYGPDKAWFYDLKQAGGGCLLDLGIHLVDAVLWTLRFPAVASTAAVLSAGGKPWTAANEEVEDHAAALLQLADGCAVQLGCSWRIAAGCDARIELNFYGTAGGASLRNVNGSFYDFVAEHFLPDRTRRVLCSPPDAWGGRAGVEWCRRLAVSSQFDPEIQQITEVARTLDRLYARNPV